MVLLKKHADTRMNDAPASTICCPGQLCQRQALPALLPVAWRIPACSSAIVTFADCRSLALAASLASEEYDTCFRQLVHVTVHDQSGHHCHCMLHMHDHIKQCRCPSQNRLQVPPLGFVDTCVELVTVTHTLCSAKHSLPQSLQALVSEGI